MAIAAQPSRRNGPAAMLSGRAAAPRGWTLHGREAFTDHADPALGRKLVRLWMWRRHVGPGLDPVALDATEFEFSMD